MTCEHPIDALRWDDHRATLLCEACGRRVESTESLDPITPQPSILGSHSATQDDA